MKCHPERRVRALCEPAVEEPVLSLSKEPAFGRDHRPTLTSPRTSSQAFPTSHSNPTTSDSHARSAQSSLLVTIPSTAFHAQSHPTQTHVAQTKPISCSCTSSNTPQISRFCVLPDTPFNIASHPNIKIAASASHNVGVIHVLTHQASISMGNERDCGSRNYLPPQNCHPERSCSRLCEQRSRRTCILPLPP